ncbi:MAG: alpha/beta hydrolase [Smithella sp.]|nr:alpha/beta hydrolase [Smithella sp.]
MLKYFDIESVKIACWVNSGNLDAHKQNLFFIHGSGGNHTIWSHQYGKFHKHYNIVAVDLPGHGQSAGQGENDIAAYSEWIKTLLQCLHLDRTVLVGHSLGAAIALRCAISYPEQLAGIVCLGAGLKMPVNALFLDYLQTHPPEIASEIVEMICKYSLAKENRTRLAGVLGDSIALAKTDIMNGDLLACNRLDLTGEADAIKIPTLIICGAEDKMTPPDLSRQLAARISGSTLEMIAGAGHMAMIEKPVELNNSLREFVESFGDTA